MKDDRHRTVRKIYKGNRLLYYQYIHSNLLMAGLSDLREHCIYITSQLPILPSYLKLRDRALLSWSYEY